MIMVGAETVMAWAVVLKRQSLDFALTGNQQMAKEMLVTCKRIETAIMAYLMKFEIDGKEENHGEK